MGTSICSSIGEDMSRAGVLCLVLSVLSLTVAKPSPQDEENAAKGPVDYAPARPDCGCQCTHHVALIKWKGRDKIIGNCNSEYPSSKQKSMFCYIKNKAHCADAKMDSEFENRWYSHEACATPKIFSPECWGPPVLEGLKAEKDDMDQTADTESAN